MSYGLIYTIPFASVNNTPMLLEISKEGYEGEPTELIGGVTPFTVSIDDEDFLYTPLRFSTGSLKLVGSDYLQNIYSTDYQQYKANLKRNGVIVWTGYIKPEVYTQDYSSALFELEVECISAMSTLEFIDFKKAGENYDFVSLFDLIKQCVTASGGDYNHIYIPHVYAKDKGAYENSLEILSSMKISEQNFFDEDEKPMKLMDVLEEVCKFLNWTCADYKGDLYFVDIDHTGEYYRFNLDDWGYQTVAGINERNVQSIGFAGSGHTLDIFGGYNKVSVKDSNYNVSELFPEEDFDKLNLLYREADVWDTKHLNAYSRKFLLPKIYRMYHYKENTDKTITDFPESELPEYEYAPGLLGALPMRICNYRLKKTGDGSYTPEISDYSWDDMICVHRFYLYTSLNPDHKILEFRKQLPLVVFWNGAIAINCKLSLSDGSETKIVPPTSNPEIKCKLSIGNKFYSSSLKKWTEDSNSIFKIYFDKDEVAKGGFVNANNDKTLSREDYSGLAGCIIDLPENALIGELKFQMFAAELYSYYTTPSDPQFVLSPSSYFLKDLELTYKRTGGDNTDDKSNCDRVYENVANEKYINELDEIEFKISSYNDDELSYSKVVMNDNFLTNNLYSAITDSNERPEELLIKRIIKQYSATKIKLTQIVKYEDGITPLTTMYDNYMVNKKFAVTGGEIDYKNESFTVKMIEKK